MTSHPADDVTVADRVAAAVRAVPGVHALHAGVAGEVATYLPGRRVDGVRVRPDRCAVHVTLVWGHPIGETADLVRAAAATLVDVPVDVTVEDIMEDSEVPDRAAARPDTRGRTDVVRRVR